MTSMDLDSPINNSEHDDFLGTVAACPTIEKHPYSKVRELRDRRIAEMSECADGFASESKSEWILLTDIDNQTFTRDFLDSDSDDDDDNDIPITWSTFDPKLNLLLIRMPNLEPHEVAGATFNELFLDAVKPTGLKYSLCLLGRTTFCGDNGAKKGDFSYSLRPARSREWPSVVLEVAYSSESEMRPKLMSDIRFWLNQSKGDVNIVITLGLDRDKPVLTIETWEVNGHGRVHRTQRVTIEKTGNEKVNVSGPLVIEFRKLFLRKTETPQERDMEISSEDLKYLGEAVWGIDEDWDG